MESALILGTGGHSRVIISMLSAVREMNMLGVIDLGEHIPGERILGVPVLGSVQMLDDFSGRDQINVYLAIGDNESRRNWFYKVKEMGFLLPNLISEKAVIDHHVQVGNGNIICPQAYIGPGAILGDNNLINTASLIEHEVRIGSHCHLAPSSTVAGRTAIGDETFIGAGATVIDQIQIAGSTKIGAGAVVIKTIERSGGTFVGVPAKCVHQH
jgi:sugar O-acyltransferase (sialic acid O-acetyltransferase NeuD family)